MKTLADQIIQPLLSEKASSRESRFNEYTIVVDQDLTKVEIRKAVERLFGVVPLKVRTVTFRKKVKKTKFGEIPTKTFKKAYVRLPEGKRIELK